jgi:N-acetylmuramoyl-L-alanine amidase
MWLTPAPEWVDLVMPVSSPPPYLLEQEHDRVTLTLYGTQATPDIIKFLQNDSLVRMINWVPDASDRVRISLELSQAPYGYLVLFDPARGFILRLRRPPRVSLARPLEGLTITVDPGHPPGGAIGPTALTEAAGVLPVAEKLRQILEARGAHVIMTRTTLAAVDLHLRSVIARRTSSHALISIHLNAFGDGVSPFPNVGTSTLFFIRKRTARAPRSGGEDAGDGTSRLGHSLSEHCDRPHDVDAVAHLRGRVSHGSRAGECRKDPGVSGTVRARCRRWRRGVLPSVRAAMSFGLARTACALISDFASSAPAQVAPNLDWRTLRRSTFMCISIPRQKG